MSDVYNNEARTRIANAKDLIRQAYSELLVVLDEKTEGHGLMQNSYIDKIHVVAIKLRELKNEL